MRQFCEHDVALTGNKEWACSSTYLDPVVDINDRYAADCPGGSNCQVCPTSCKGDAVAADERFPVTMDGATKTHLCKWAVRREKWKMCALPLNCCETCCQKCAGDAAGSDLFLIPCSEEHREDV